MDPYFNFFYNDSGFGPGIQARTATPQALAAYRGKLPDKMLAYWQRHGWRGWADGLCWTLDPEPWQGVVDLWLEDTPFAQRDHYCLVARGAFGKLVLWGERTGPSLSIDTTSATFYPADLAGAIAKRGIEEQASFFFASQSIERFDHLDEGGESLFAQATARLGRLDHETMYGFVPAIALGGRAIADNLQKLDAIVHLTQLAQLTEKRIVL